MLTEVETRRETGRTAMARLFQREQTIRGRALPHPDLHGDSRFPTAASPKSQPRRRAPIKAPPPSAGPVHRSLPFTHHTIPTLSSPPGERTLPCPLDPIPSPPARPAAARAGPDARALVIRLMQQRGLAHNCRSRGFSRSRRAVEGA
jgi:hypothetical protein